MRLLGFTPMGDMHEEFHTLALKLVTYSDASAANAIERFKQHTIGHSEQEGKWIYSINFPPRGYYLAEHAAALKSVGDIRQAVAPGEAGIDVVRDLEMALFDWFPIRADYLNSALAVWMTRQTMGGEPIVLRRTLA